MIVLSFLCPHTCTATIHRCTHTPKVSSPNMCLLYLCSACLSSVSFQGDTPQLPPQRTCPPTLAVRQTSCFATHHNGTMPSFFQPAFLCGTMYEHVQSEQKYSLLPHGNPSVTVTNVLLLSALGILTNIVQSKK